MADATDTPQNPTDFAGIGELFTKGVMNALAGSNIPKALVSQGLQNHAGVFALAWKLFLDGITFAATEYEKGEQAIQPIAERAVAPILAGIFGASVSGADFSRRVGPGGGSDAARSIVDGFMRAITGGATGPVEPSTEGSTRLAAAAVAASIESNINALIPELVSDFLPFDLGKITALTDLPEGILRSLGVGRLVRRALTPAIDATCATPAKWYYAQQYRQALLGAGVIAKQVARGRWTTDQATAELSKQGWTDDKIEAILNDANRFLSAADAYLLVRVKEWNTDDARTHLQDSGYDADTAALLVELEQAKIIATFDDEMATAAIDAYAAGRIGDSALDAFIHGATFTDQHVAQLRELAIAKKTLNAKGLSSAEAEACVMAGILTYADYRAALARENYSDDAITSLDLLLRSKADKNKALADHKAEAAAEAAAAKQAKADAAVAKKQAHDAAVALKQLGKPADMETAYVRGLVPLDRYQATIAPLYDAGTVDTLLAVAQDKRAAYAAQQQKANQALTRAKQRGIDVSQLQAAVKTGALTLGQYGERLTALGFVADDVQVLTATLDAEVQAAAQAKTLHDAATAAAKVKHVDLASFELLVRRGHRTMSDYVAFVTSLGYDPASVAVLQEKLQLQIDADAKAAQTTAAASTKLAANGLNLAQAARAVVLGVQTIDWFNTWLIKAGVDAQAQTTIVATVQADADNAQAARQRRAAADARRDASGVGVADLARAARLGVIPVATYTADLLKRGYSSDDAALETDLLTTEIQNTAAAQQAHATAATAATGKGLNLAQLDAAFKAGLLTLDTYTQRVIDLGFSADDAKLIASLESDQAALVATASARQAALAAADPGKEIPRAEFVKSVKAGLQTIDDYRAYLTEQQYGADDVDLLVALLQSELDAAAAKAAPVP